VDYELPLSLINFSELFHGVPVGYSGVSG